VEKAMRDNKITLNKFINTGAKKLRRLFENKIAIVKHII
jgi:hypothetical protein